MSSRTAYQRLRRNHVDAGFGPRFALTVRVPRDAFGEAYPVASTYLAATLANYTPTGGGELGCRLADGTGSILTLYTRGDDDALRAEVRRGDIEEWIDGWWSIPKGVRFGDDDDGYEWLAEYAAHCTVVAAWEQRNLHRGNFGSPSLNDAWDGARSSADAFYAERATVNSVDVWHVNFRVKTCHRDSMRWLARDVAQFVQRARRVGIDARYF